MARRDNQGIQIAMIVFILTTLLFMVGTYLGYSSWAAASSELDQAKKSVSDKDSQMRSASAAADGMKTAIGLDPTLQDDAAKTEADRWVQDVMGAGLPEESRNFLGIVRARDTRIADLNSQLAKANQEVRDLNAQLKKTKETADQAVAMAQAAEEKAVSDLEKRQAEFNSTLSSREQAWPDWKRIAELQRRSQRRKQTTLEKNLLLHKAMKPRHRTEQKRYKRSSTKLTETPLISTTDVSWESSQQHVPSW